MKNKMAASKVSYIEGDVLRRWKVEVEVAVGFGEASRREAGARYFRIGTDRGRMRLESSAGLG